MIARKMPVVRRAQLKEREMLKNENPRTGPGASRNKRPMGVETRYLDTTITPPAQSSNAVIFRAIEALAALPGTADIRHGLAALLQRPGGHHE